MLQNGMLINTNYVIQNLYNDKHFFLLLLLRVFNLDFKN